LATNYPAALDVYTRPLAADPMDNPSHSGVHDNSFDAIEAIEAKVGIAASTPVANSVLAGTAAGNSSWSSGPRLSSVADAGGTDRISISTVSPHITITCNQRITGQLDMSMAFSGTVTAINVSPTISITATWTGIQVSPTITITSGTPACYGLTGVASIRGASGGSNYIARGLNFQAIAQAFNVTTAFSELSAIYARANAAGVAGAGILTVTTAYGVQVHVDAQVLSGGVPTITTGYGVFIADPLINAGGFLVNWCGLRIENTTDPTTTNYLVEVGPATPYFRVMGNFTAAANQTPIYISEGVTPTLRQLKTVASDASGHVLPAGTLVAILV